MSKSQLNSKFKVLQKLFNNNCKSEKEILALSLSDVIKIESITKDEMIIIDEIQKAVADKRFISYLADKEVLNAEV